MCSAPYVLNKTYELLLKRINTVGLLLVTFIEIMILSLIKQQNLYILFYLSILPLACVYFLVLYAYIVTTYNMLRSNFEMKHFQVNNFEKDISIRIEIAERIVGLFVAILLIISLVFSFNKTTEILLCFLFFAISLYLVLKLNSIVLTSIIIFTSTIPGFFLVLTIILAVTTILIVIGNGGNFSSYDIWQSVNSGEFILIVIIFSKYYPLIWINMLISFVAQLLIVFIRPPYLLQKTKFSFRILSTLLSIIIALLLLYADRITDVLGVLLSITKFEQYILNEIFVVWGGKEKIITESSIQRMIATLFLPYTIGSIICLFVIDGREQINKRKARKYYYKAVVSQHHQNNNDVILYLKKCIYYGGENYELFVYNNTDFREYLADLGYKIAGQRGSGLNT